MIQMAYIEFQGILTGLDGGHTFLSESSCSMSSDQEHQCPLMEKPSAMLVKFSECFVFCDLRHVCFSSSVVAAGKEGGFLFFLQNTPEIYIMDLFDSLIP